MVLMHMVGPTPFKLKLDDILVERMTCILNGPGHHISSYAVPTMELQTCVTGTTVIAAAEDPDSSPICMRSLP